MSTKIDDRTRYMLDNWKIFIHLLFRTKRFGVNNHWWNYFDSGFGLPWYKIIIRILLIYPLFETYTEIKFRAIACSFLSEKTNKLIGWKLIKK